MTDAERLPDPLPALPHLPRGCAVLLRHYEDPARYELAVRLQAACRRFGLRMLVGADPRLAAAVGADGVHWPEALVGRETRHWRTWHRRGWLVTAAAHSRQAIHRASAWGADAVLLSPVFPTTSHVDATPLGPLKFAVWAGTSSVPVYALGGISGSVMPRLVSGGASGFAGIGFLTPQQAAQ